MSSKVRRNMHNIDVSVQTRTSIGVRVSAAVAIVATVTLGSAFFAAVIFSTPRSAPVGDATAQLRQKITAYQQAAPDARATLVTEIVSLATQRMGEVQKKIAAGDTSVFTSALTTSEYAAAPAEAQQYLEQAGVRSGVLQVRIEDRTDNAVVHVSLRATEGTSATEAFTVVGRQPTELTSGIAVEDVRGFTLQETFYAQANTGTYRAPEAAVTGPQNVLVLMANFTDLTFAPTAKAALESSYFGTGSATVKAYYQEVSNNAVTVTGTVKGPYTLGIPASSCTFDSVKALLMNPQVDADVQWLQAGTATYNRIVIVTPYTTACGAGGTSYGGVVQLGTPEGNILASLSQVYHGTSSFSLHVHELGHGFGVNHAGFLNCVPNVMKRFFWQCAEHLYGDDYDVMGNANAFHLNARHKEKLGWLPSGALQVISEPGTYQVTLQPYATTGGGTKAVKIIRETFSSGSEPFSSFYLERRTRLGFDATLPTSLTNGVILHWVLHGATTFDSDTLLLDMTPDGNVYTTSPVITVGQTFTDISENGQWETQVTLDTLTATTANLTIRRLPAVCTGNIQPGQCSGAQYCDPTTRTLQNNCTRCGFTCSSGTQCQTSSGACTCSDGTLVAQCNAARQYCSANGTLEAKCGICGCAQFYKCDTQKSTGNGTCVQDPTQCCMETTEECKLPLCPWAALPVDR